MNQDAPKRDFGIDLDTMLTYCADPCGPNHPNSLENIQKRGRVAYVVPIRKATFIRMMKKHYPEDVVYTFNRVMGRSFSVRFAPAHIFHVMKVGQEKGFATFSEALHHIIEEHMADHPEYAAVRLERCIFDIGPRDTEKPPAIPKPKAPEPEPQGGLEGIQPALRYQQEHGIPAGTVIDGTAFFDTGLSVEDLGKEFRCAACGGTTYTRATGAVGCQRCKAGYRAS